ncbi:platelet-activating factor acetylhydrolase isoform II-domain-containing protein [Venturia nashicola]|nr:platelet-activating factor acetylhydrolase isoform II-domain-containing protein [Venturia nashicola]
MPILPDSITGKQKTGRRSSFASQNGKSGRVPNAKKPRSRPPADWRDQRWFLHGTLPRYTGPYSVGVMDIEVPAEHPQSFSHITRHKHHLFKLETVLFNIYYPSAFGSGAGKDSGGQAKWSRETWLSRPRRKIAQGYGRFAGFGPRGDLAVPWFAITTMLTKIPAFRNAELARHWPPSNNTYTAGAEVKNQEGPPPEGESAQPKFPLLIFSHGLGGTRSTYSSVCGEFASYGFVVCAIEHRDGSGPRTYINHTPGVETSIDSMEAKGDVDHAPKQKKKNYHKMDYVFPKANPRDTVPNSEKGVDQELRAAQIQLRLAEIEEAFKVLTKMCNGQGAEIARHNLRRKGFKGGSSRGLQGVDWSLWENRFHLDQVTILGHSFGAATTIELLRASERFPYVSQGIIYDIWGAAVRTPSTPNGEDHQLKKPLLGINSEAFMYWQSNLDTVSALTNESKLTAPSWLITVRGTIHVSQSDFSILYPHICTFLLKMTANPKRALDLNISASLEFLSRVLIPERSAIIRRTMIVENILDLEPIKELPVDRKPNDKWTAVRLKIPHEARARLGASIERKMKRNRPDKDGKNESSAKNEIWMHIKTEEEGIKAWERQRGVGGKKQENDDGRDENVKREEEEGEAKEEEEEEEEEEEWESA